MAKKKYFNGSYGFVGWVEDLGRNLEFSSEKEYLEFINDPERIKDTKEFVKIVEDEGLNITQVGVF